MILDAPQFRQLVTDVAMALAADSTGVGEVEVVDTLVGINSLPALKIEYGRGKVVEAPLSLLSKKADDAADEAYEAIMAATVAAVGATAAADRADAERVGLEELKQHTRMATSESLTQTVVSKDETRLTAETRFAALTTLTDLQSKLIDVVILISEAHSGAEELAEFQAKGDETFVIIARNTEELLRVTEDLKSLRAQVAELTRQAFVAIDVCNLSADDARLFASLAMQAAEAAEQASIRAVGSAAGADAAASHATEQAERARVATEKSTIQTSLSEKTTKRAELAATNADASRMAIEQNEDERKASELERLTAEQDRKGSEAIRKTSEQGRKDAEALRVLAEDDRVTEFATLKEESETATESATSVAKHPTYIGADNYVYQWDFTTASYNKADIFVKGDAFNVTKTYLSVDAMNADVNNSGITEGSFVLINTNDVENPDNGGLYVKVRNEDTTYSYSFLVDMSGAIGFTGKTPQFVRGVITTGAAGSDVQVSLSESGVDGDGNPVYALNVTIPRGNPGATFKVLGHFGTLDALKTTIPDGSAMDGFYSIGSLPYTYYAWYDGDWQTQGRLQGVDGKSAYQVAVDNGFVGSEAEWLTSLVGATGKPGASGSNGLSCTHSWNGTELSVTSASGTSSANLKGEKGDKGDKGDAGVQGIKGDTGATGSQGIQGNTGATGPQGGKGDKGDKGDTGLQGIQGVQGVQGERGYTGSQGSQGPQGPGIAVFNKPYPGSPGYAELRGLVPRYILYTFIGPNGCAIGGICPCESNSEIGITDGRVYFSFSVLVNPNAVIIASSDLSLSVAIGLM